MKRKIHISAIILLQVILHDAFAQNNEIRFNLVEGINGKPLGKITAIAQDPHGYMWFCGQDEKCLYRYDGNRMISFSHDNLNPNSLAGSSLETIHVDDKGIVWVGFNGGGLDRFDPKTGIFKNFRNISNDSGSLAGNNISAILKDHQGRLWVGTDNGLDLLDEKTGKFIHYQNQAGNPRSLSSNVVRAIYEDRKGVIWVGTGFPFSYSNKKPDNDGGLNRLMPDGTFTRYMHDPKNSHTLINNKVRSIFEDSRGVFWIGTSNDGLHTMDRSTGIFERHLYNPAKPYQLSRPPLKQDEWKKFNDQITFICEDGASAIWIGSYAAGINHYDPVTKKITHYESSNGFKDSSGWHAFKSRDGVLWLSTQENNLFRVDASNKKINGITSKDIEVTRFLEDKEGFLWVGTRLKGLLQYDENKKLIHHFNSDSSKPFSIKNNTVHALFQNQGDTIWLGTHNGVEIFNKNSQQFSRFDLGFQFKNPDGNPIYNIIQDKQGLIWFATGEGLVGYNPQDGSIKRYQLNEKDSGTIRSDRILFLLEDKTDELWVGTEGGGVSRLNKQTNRFQHYLPAGFNGICMYQDQEGTIWAGTNNGLYRYSQKDDRFVPFFESESGLSNEFIFGIIEDDKKNLWLITPSVVLKINSARNEILTYGSKFGIIQRSLSPIALYRTRKGELLVGHDNGFYAFYPEDLAIKTDLKIITTDFFINSLPVLPGKGSPLEQPIEDINELSLKYNQNNIAFNFAAIDYYAPENIKYFTMLEGYDNNWREARGEKSSYYFNIPPGKYVYRLKAFNSDGTKGEKLITILITPPWWKTWWAYTMYVLLLGAAIFVIYRLQKQRIIRKERQKAQLFELAQAKEIEKAYKELKATQAQLIQSEKMASLGELTAGIAHEIQNPLNFVNNFSDVNIELVDEMEKAMHSGNNAEAMAIAKDIKQNLDKISHHGKRADGIVKGMLQHSRINTGQKESTDINALADEYLRLSYHGLRAKDKSFQATIQTELDPNVGQLNVVPQEIGRVLLNLYNNAFYAVSSKSSLMNDAESAKTRGPSDYRPTITVSTKKIGDTLEVRVKDNGNGIPQATLDKIFQPFFTTKPAGQGTGLGLSLSYDIIKVHGGDIKVETKEGEYAEFIISLPYR